MRSDLAALLNRMPNKERREVEVEKNLLNELEEPSTGETILGLSSAYYSEGAANGLLLYSATKVVFATTKSGLDRWKEWPWRQVRNVTVRAPLFGSIDLVLVDAQGNVMTFRVGRDRGWASAMCKEIEGRSRRGQSPF